MTDNASKIPQHDVHMAKGEASGQGQAMWGGRFSAKPADLMQAINVSIGFDKRLAPQDLAGSRAHAAMLRDQGVISSEDEAAIQGGLSRIEAEIADGSFPFRAQGVGARAGDGNGAGGALRPRHGHP